MDLVMIILVTALVIWKNGYTIYLMYDSYKKKNKKKLLINSVFILDYLMYYYFIYKAASDSIKSPCDGPVWFVVIFILLTSCNILYDLEILDIE
ncbi:hypothetical protein [uncultured Clostridium sp.]|uniref:hypothetical protein n=1 Tax=uncultured Clostridium sp. TaxID=59620 RepID=UPI0025CDB110|nr:hypothetical protein [uncultured Clostridium sp.]